MGYPGLPIVLSAFTPASMVAPTSPAGGRFSSTAIASGFAVGSALFPVEDMIEVNDSVFPGWFAATSCPIAPPNDAPTICARSIRSASSSPAASFAISSSVYATLGFFPWTISVIILTTSAGPALSNFCDNPTSRLS